MNDPEQLPPAPVEFVSYALADKAVMSQAEARKALNGLCPFCPGVELETEKYKPVGAVCPHCESCFILRDPGPEWRKRWGLPEPTENQSP